MEVRPIDGNELLDIERLLDTDVVRQSKTASWLLDQVLHDIQAMPALTPPNEWVSVEERLPEKKQDVLMLFDTGNMAVGWWHDADEHITFWCTYTDYGFYTDCDCIPTHWMLLPAPPDRRPPEGAGQCLSTSYL